MFRYILSKPEIFPSNTMFLLHTHNAQRTPDYAFVVQTAQTHIFVVFHESLWILHTHILFVIFVQDTTIHISKILHVLVTFLRLHIWDQERRKNCKACGTRHAVPTFSYSCFSSTNWLIILFCKMIWSLDLKKYGMVWYIVCTMIRSELYESNVKQTESRKTKNQSIQDLFAELRWFHRQLNKPHQCKQTISSSKNHRKTCIYNMYSSWRPTIRNSKTE